MAPHFQPWMTGTDPTCGQLVGDGRKLNHCEEQLTYQGYLAELLLTECDDRDGAPPSAESSRELSPGQVAR